MRRIPKIAWAVIGLMSCGETRLSVPLPAESADHRVAVFSVESETQTFAEAMSLSRAYELRGELPLRVELLGYRRDFDALRFDAGEITSSADGCELLTEEPPDAIFVTEIAERDATPSWEHLLPAADPGEAVRSLTIPRRAGAPCVSDDPCASFETPEAIIIPDARRATDWGIMLQDGRVLIGTEGSLSFVIDATGTPTPVERGNVSLHSVIQSADGTLWFGSQRGQVLTGHLNGLRLETSPFTQADTEGWVFDLAVLSSSTGPELLTLSLDGVLSRYTETAGWSTLRKLTPTPTDAAPKGGIAQVGASEAVIVWAFDRIVLRYEGGKLSDETPDDLVEGGTVIEHFSFGTVFGTGRTGTTFLNDGSRWSRVGGDQTLGIDALALAEFRDGFVVGGESGSMRQYTKDAYCPLGIQRTGSIRGIIPFSDELILLYGDDGGLANTTLTITLLRAPPR